MKPASLTLKLESQECIVINSGEKQKRVPTPQLLSNIPMLYGFLFATVDDWKRVSAPYQRAIDQAQIDDVWASTRAFMNLQPDYLRYLFSYCFFYVSIENAFRSLYNELATAASAYRLSVPGTPKKTAYIRKVRTVRNIAIAHFPSDEAKLVTSVAAMSWQPLSWGRQMGERWDVDTITFGGMTHRFKDERGDVIAESDDLEIRGIAELHDHCILFLTAYDQGCCDLLASLKVAVAT